MSLVSVKLVLISQCPDRRKWHFQGSSFQSEREATADKLKVEEEKLDEI